VVADSAANTDDLVGDMVDVLTPVRARLYRRRGERSRSVRVLAATMPGRGEAR
jgi:predicted site-specific integrase-resolvase